MILLFAPMRHASYLQFFLTMLVRYSIVAGAAFVIFYILFRERFHRIKIQKHFPKQSDYRRELLFSLSSMFIIAFCVFSARSPLIRPHTQIYDHIRDHGWLYFIASIFLALFVHDTYFYWTHRAMHHPKLFKIFHLVHHRSTNPTPWAAYSFHPLEAVVEGGIIWVIVFLIPMHPLAIALFAMVMIVYNVYGHLGYEAYPRWLIKSKIGRWLNTSTNHNMHHKYFHDNYGLYFRFWDIIMKTTHPGYEEAINELVAKKETEN